MSFRPRKSRRSTSLALASTALRAGIGAFTLVELLVVISVIALLLAILLPGLNKAVAAGQTATCLSNLRQLQISLTAYIQDNWGHSAPYMPDVPSANNPGSYWTSQLTPYVTGMPYNASSPMNTMTSVRLCPTASMTNPTQIGIQGQGLAFYCWGPGPSGGPCQNQTCSYEYNGYLYYLGTQYGQTLIPALGLKPDQGCENQVSTSAIPGSSNVPVQSYFWQLPDIGTTPSSSIPTICDGVWVDAWPCEKDVAPDDPTVGVSVFVGSQTGGSTRNMDRVCVARHNLGKFINVAFLDGHAETVRLSQLWTLQWHRNWQTPNPLPQP